MTNDIVIRLRKEASFNGPNDTVQKDLLIRAANEIERLRSLLDSVDPYTEHWLVCATRYGKLRDCDCGLAEVRRG